MPEPVAKFSILIHAGFEPSGENPESCRTVGVVHRLKICPRLALRDATALIKGTYYRTPQTTRDQLFSSPDWINGWHDNDVVFALLQSGSTERVLLFRNL